MILAIRIFTFGIMAKFLDILPKSLHKSMFSQEIYYISVNAQHEKLLNKTFKITYDLESIIHLPTQYKGLGVDRKAACLCVDDGVVVDVGSAITIDCDEWWQAPRRRHSPGV